MEEESFLNHRRLLPPALPPPPPHLSPQELKRRLIVGAIVHSENSYHATLERLVNVSCIRVINFERHFCLIH